MKKIFWAIPAIIITITLFVLSNIKYSILPELNLTFTDKIAHFIAFFTYTAFVIIGIDSYVSSKKKLIEYAVVWAAFYGIFDEVHQYFVPGRDCNIYDWFADLAGILIAILLIKYILKIKNKISLWLNKKHLINL
jgi:VanZ family protein